MKLAVTAISQALVTTESLDTTSNMAYHEPTKIQKASNKQRKREGGGRGVSNSLNSYVEEQHTNILGSFCHRASKNGTKLVCIQTYFNPVIKKSKYVEPRGMPQQRWSQSHTESLKTKGNKYKYSKNKRVLVPKA